MVLADSGPPVLMPLNGPNYTTFSGWRQRQRKVKSLPAFVQVEVAAPATPEQVSVLTFDTN